MVNENLHQRYKEHQIEERELHNLYYKLVVENVDRILHNKTGTIDISSGNIEYIYRQNSKGRVEYIVTLFNEAKFVPLEFLQLNDLYIVLEQIEDYF